MTLVDCIKLKNNSNCCFAIPAWCHENSFSILTKVLLCRLECCVVLSESIDHWISSQSVDSRSWKLIEFYDPVEIIQLVNIFPNLLLSSFSHILSLWLAFFSSAISQSLLNPHIELLNLSCNSFIIRFTKFVRLLLCILWEHKSKTSYYFFFIFACDNK